MADVALGAFVQRIDIQTSGFCALRSFVTGGIGILVESQPFLVKPFQRNVESVREPDQHLAGDDRLQRNCLKDRGGLKDEKIILLAFRHNHLVCFENCQGVSNRNSAFERQGSGGSGRFFQRPDIGDVLELNRFLNLFGESVHGQLRIPERLGKPLAQMLPDVSRRGLREKVFDVSEDPQVFVDSGG